MAGGAVVVGGVAVGIPGAVQPAGRISAAKVRDSGRTGRYAVGGGMGRGLAFAVP